jgi:hypothetical protein
MKIEQPNVYYNKQRKHWVCDLRYHGHGRKAFHTKELAVTEAQKFFGGLIEHGTRNHNQVDLPLDVITDVKRSMQLISPLGLSIFEVCKSYVDLVNQNKSAVAVKVFDAGEAWIKTKKLEPITTGTVINHQGRLNAFYRKYGNRLIHEITPEEMHEYIFGLPFKTESKKDYRKTLREFFQWCIYPKKYIKVNPCAFVKFGRRILKPATILNLKEAEKMFKAALNADQDIKTMCSCACLPGCGQRLKRNRFIENRSDQSRLQSIRARQSTIGLYRLKMGYLSF